MDLAESYPAHIIEIDGEMKVQECRDHCRNSAEYAKSDLQPAALENAGFLAGLLHDCGKFTGSFRKYIYASHAGEKVKKGSVMPDGMSTAGGFSRPFPV